ncbi:hypothetical protein, partial [Mesorhizobium sp. M7A.F.Ca.US.005.03.2.1]|uniref:hypothetical protein n=1 Tax=Mesorhizobium sp. M7A.F.Ca.US.005.03.2.1 TaxID=2496737 RepID=UPI0019CFFE85
MSQALAEANQRLNGWEGGQEMTDMTHSATNGQAAQTKAATVKTTLRSNIGRSANGFSAQGLYDPV